MATWLSHSSKQQRILRKNAFLWCGIYLLIFAVLLLRLLWLQTVRGVHYNELARQYRNRDVVLPATRGRLLDRNLAVLSLDDQRPSLFVDPTLVQYPNYIANQLATIIERPADEISADMTRQLPFVWVKRNITHQTANEVARLGLPGLQVRQDAERYRLGIVKSQAKDIAEVSAQLAKVLGVPVGEIEGQLTTPSQPGAAEAASIAAPTWLRGVYYETTRRALAAQKIPGLLIDNLGPGYSLGVDPRCYTSGDPQPTAGEAAVELAPLLGLEQRTIETRLLFRPRFVWLKRNLTMQMSDAVQQLQGTLYVVEPGKLYGTALADAAERLETLLKEDEDTPPKITRQAIADKLAIGAQPGALAVKLVGKKPSLSLQRALANKPIPGVVYGLPGVSLQHERRRQYPYSTLASATLGFVTYSNTIHGAFGLEQTQDRTLHGIDGREIKEIDARHVTIPERCERIEPKDGHDVVLTLDLNIQQAAETELAKVVTAYHAARGECIVMDPNNGEILAMASAPSWDANAPAKVLSGDKPLPLVNPIISNFYEPGSTFKLVAVMASLEEGVIKDGQQVTYCSGAMPVGKRVVHEAHNAHGQVDAERLLEQSCNIGAATLALKLGQQRFLKWCRALGYGDTTGLELLNESPGYLNAANAGAKITLANMGFGQSLAVTPVQMLRAYSVAANGGYLVKPHLVKTRTLPNGSLQQTPIERKQVCSPHTAELMRGYLEKVVSKGTGGQAAIPGYLVAGKTGTAQKPGVHGYNSGLYIGSFIGFMPADKPRLAIICVIDEPKGSIYGGVVAAPVIREVGRRALQYLHVFPSERVLAEQQYPKVH